MTTNTGGAAFPYAAVQPSLSPQSNRAGSLAEREACAKVCDKYAEGPKRNYSENIADDIRARGEKV